MERVTENSQEKEQHRQRPGALKSYPPPIPETRIRNSSFSTQGRNKKRSSDPGAHNPKYFSHVSTLPEASGQWLVTCDWASVPQLSSSA